MPETPKLGLPLIEADQGLKHITHNEALAMLDLGVQVSFISDGLDVPPGSPGEGDTYAIGQSAIGDWAGHDGQLASYFDGDWRYAVPGEGWMGWNQSLGTLQIHLSGQWQPYAPTFAELQNLGLLGVNTTADTTNKLAVKTDAALFASDSAGDMRIKVSKQVGANTASHLFQTNFSGRAEFGLLGNDDFTLKVSPDNFSSSSEALIAESASGNVKFPKWMSVGHSATPISTLHIVGESGGGATALTVDGDGGSADEPLRVRDPSGETKCVIRGDGDLLNFNNSYGGISDARSKSDIAPAGRQWDDIQAIKLRSFRLKEAKGRLAGPVHLGVIAQDLLETSPGLVSENADGAYSVKYSILYLKAIGALQEAMARIEALEARIDISGAARNDG